MFLYQRWYSVFHIKELQTYSRGAMTVSQVWIQPQKEVKASPSQANCSEKLQSCSRWYTWTLTSFRILYKTSKSCKKTFMYSLWVYSLFR
jgi:hypothetical protein